MTVFLPCFLRVRFDSQSQKTFVLALFKEREQVKVGGTLLFSGRSLVIRIRDIL